MSQQTSSLNNKTASRGIVGGLVLILLGISALVSQLTQFDPGRIFLPILGVIFLVAGVLQRRPGLTIPGGIILGLAACELVASGIFAGLSDSLRSALFLFSLAGGFAVIPVASYLAGRAMLWPFVPAACIALAGAVILAGVPALTVLEASRYFGPAILIALGAFFILNRSK